MDMQERSIFLGRPANHEAWLLRMKTMLQDNISHPELSVRWLAQQLFLSERQFSRKTQQLTGHTPNNLIREAKLQVAHKLLRLGEVKSVKATAKALHFADVKYFSRLFLRRFGHYPSELLHDQ
jgi:AraC-like DNA-binding protein